VDVAQAVALRGRGDGPRELADRQQRVRAPRDVGADGLMRADGETPKLQHVAEHRDPSAPDVTQHGESGAHGGRARVVRVVDDRDAGRTTDAHPVCRALEGPECDRGLVQRHAERDGGADRRERGPQQMASGERQEGVRAGAVRLDGERDPIQAEVADIGRANVGTGRLAVQEHARPRA